MEVENLKKFSTSQLLNFCIGFFGLQFAWQMRIILSGPLTESFGASPLLFGLIWLAGPFTGIVVQPIIGALSDNTETPFGRRLPYLMGGAILGAIGLFLLPNSQNIASLFGENAPWWSALFIAAIMIWVIDACVNAAQGPYRALIPDNIPREQHALANSYLSFAIGLGSVIAAAAAPVLKYVFDYQMSTSAQFYMAAIAFLLGMSWTCLTIKERKLSKTELKIEEQNAREEIKKSFFENLKDFFLLSPEVGKICTVQFFSWIGVMSLNIFFTQYVIHVLYQVPDLTAIPQEFQGSYNALVMSGQNFSSICFAAFNLICFIIAIPIGKLAERFGNKKVHFVCLLLMALAYILLTFLPNTISTVAAMALAGIGWASILALPFAMLSKYIKEGTEGAVMGIFNIFIAAPQILVCTVLAWFINISTTTINNMPNNHYEYAFLVGAFMLILACASTLTIKED